MRRVLDCFWWLQSELKRTDDMFCDDIFGESPAGGRRMVGLFLRTVWDTFNYFLMEVHFLVLQILLSNGIGVVHRIS